MLVRQLVGRFAGQIIEMPFHVAQSCLANGTAALPDAEVRVRGFEVAAPPSEEPEDAPLVVVVPENWRKLHHFTRMKIARQIEPSIDEGGITAAEADSVIEGYLARHA
jgi:hypothetical protein